MLSVSWIDLVNINDGESGVGIERTVIEYALSDSGTIIPASFITDDDGHVLLDNQGNPLTSGIWSTEIPTPSPGEWLWIRTTQYYTDGTSTVSYSVSRNGENPYTIILSNENHTFPASWLSAVASSTVCNVYVYQGGNKIPATIGEITGMPPGMIVTIQNNGTLNSRFMVSVTEEMTSQNGTLVIPITVGDLSFEKFFTYSLAFDGAPGNGVSNVTEMYATSTSTSEVPEDNEFNTSIPELNAHDRCLWNYEIVDYSDGSIITTEKHIIGMYSEDGVSITSVKNYYLASTQSTGITTDTTGWTEIPQPISETLKYLWNYEAITYSSGRYDVTEPIIIGVHGDSAITYSMQISHAAVVLENTGNYNPRSVTVTAKYQQGSNTLRDYYGRFKIETTNDNSSWTERYISTSNETTKTYTIPSNVKSIRFSLYMSEGTTVLLDQQTVPIITDGVGISSVVEYYAVNNSSSAAPPYSSFDTTIPTMTETDKYLWNYEEVTYTDGHIETTDKVVIGVFGSDGSDGRGISSITECYLATSLNSGVTTSTSGWTTTIQTITPENKYLWNYEIINYTTGDPETTTPVIIGTYGERGDDAYTVILSNESHTFSGGTSSAVGGSTTCNVIGYKGATQESVTIGTITGCPNGMTTAIQNNNTTSASFTVTVTTSMNTRNGILNIPVTIDGHVVNKQFSYSLAIKGDKGDAATTYSLTISHAAVVLQDTGVFNPTNILLHAKSQRGDGQLSDYSGRFKVDVTTNNSSWIQGYTSESDESSYTFTIPAGTKSIKCGLYLAGGFTTLIDQQVIPVLSDGIGIASVTEYYAVNQSSSSAPGDSDFSADVPTMTETNRFLWNYELVTYTDGSTEKTDKVVIGVWGEQGISGKGISAITEYYLATTESSNVTTSTSGWTTTIQTVTNTNKYLWNYEVIDYTDGPSTTTTPVIIGVYGDRGDDGIDGYTIVLSNESHTFSGDSSAAIPSNTICNVIGYKGITQQSVTIGTITGCPTGMSTTIVNNGTTNALFRVTVTDQMVSRSGVLTVPCTIDNKTFNKQFSYSLTLAGESTTVYNLLVSSAVISRMQSGQYNPPTATIQAYKQVGSGNMELYNGRFKIETTLNNETWTQNYISTSDEASKEFVIPSSTGDNPILAVKFSLYAAGGTDQILDYQTVPIINDGSIGNGIKEYIIEYALSDSDTVIPGGPFTDGNNVLLNDDNAFSNSVWSTEIPGNIPEGLYLWTRVTFVFTDGERTVAYTVSRNGVNGKDGEDGTYIVKQIQQFYVSTSNTELIGGVWSYVEPEELYDGEYLWKRFENVMSDTSILYSEAYCETVISGVISLVDEVEKTITNKVWQSDITNMINEYDGSTAKQIRDRVTETEQNVDGIYTNISDIRSIVRNKADDSTVKEITRRVQEVTDTASEHTRIISEDILGNSSSSIKSIAQQTANKFSWLVGNSGTGTSTTFTLTDRVAKLVADHINLYGLVTFHGLASDAQEKITDAQETADIANEKTDTGLGMKINYSTFNQENYGECYLHGYEDGQPADVDGYIYWNKIKRTVNKTMIDPNLVPPYWKTIYLVLRLSSANSSTGTLYMVWYDEGWKYTITPTPDNIRGTWIWNEERDVVIGQFVETSSEGKIVDAYLYTPPRRASHIRSGAENTYHDWIYNNGTDLITAKDIVDSWSTTAQDGTTTINGGLIETHTILSQALATNAIMSQNYSSGADDGEETPAGNFSISGSYLDLSTGNIFTPNFGVKGGNAYFNGDIHALSGEIGGWVIDDEKMYYSSSVPGTTGSAFIKPDGSTSSNSIGGSGSTNENWMMTVSDGFGVTTDGKLYCNDAVISGAINATSLTVSPGVTFPGVITSDNIVSNLVDVSESNTDYANQRVDTNWVKYDYFGTTYITQNTRNNELYLSTLKKCYFNKDDTIKISFDYKRKSSASAYDLTFYVYYYDSSRNKLNITDSTSIRVDVSTADEKSASATLTLTNYTDSCVYYRLLFYSELVGLSRTAFKNIKGLWSSFSPIATSGDYTDLLNKPNLTIYIAKDGTVGEEPTEGATGFKVDQDGVLTAANAIIWGEIFASAGEIGGCSINNGFLEVNAAHITGTLTADKIAVGLGMNLVDVDELKQNGYNQSIDNNWVDDVVDGVGGGYCIRASNIEEFTSNIKVGKIYLSSLKKYNFNTNTLYLNVQFNYIHDLLAIYHEQITIKKYDLSVFLEAYDRDRNFIDYYHLLDIPIEISNVFTSAKKSGVCLSIPSNTVYYRLIFLLRIIPNRINSTYSDFDDLINQIKHTCFKNIIIREKQNSSTIAEIGGWTVKDTAIYRNSESWGNAATGSAYIGVDGISITDKFKVSNTGELTCNGATINGIITANVGSSIGPLRVTGIGFISGTRSHFNIDQPGICVESNGNFGISGAMTAWSRLNDGDTAIQALDWGRHDLKNDVDKNYYVFRICKAEHDDDSNGLKNIVTKFRTDTNGYTYSSGNYKTEGAFYHNNSSKHNPCGVAQQKAEVRAILGRPRTNVDGSNGEDYQTSYPFFEIISEYSEYIDLNVMHSYKASMTNACAITSGGFSFRIHNKDASENNEIYRFVTLDPNYLSFTKHHRNTNQMTAVYSIDLLTGWAGTGSDERIKNIISRNSIHKDLFMSIIPIEYTLKDIENDTIHFGVGAQTLEKAIKDCGYENLSLVKHDKEKDQYTVNYTELQMLTIPVVQDHEYRIRKLEEENEYLREKIKLLTKEEV